MIKDHITNHVEQSRACDSSRWQFRFHRYSLIVWWELYLIPWCLFLFCFDCSSTKVSAEADNAVRFSRLEANDRSKPKKTTKAQIPPPPAAGASADELGAYLEKHGMDVVEAASYVPELSKVVQKSINELHVSADRYSTRKENETTQLRTTRIHLALPSDADEKTAKEFFNLGKTSQLPLTELCQNKTVCTIGESHSSLGAKAYLANNIAALAKKGYMLIGFEMAEQKNQKTLDGYMRGKVSKAKLIEIVFDCQDAPGQAEGYVNILDAMKSYNTRTRAQLKPIALEIECTPETAAHAGSKQIRQRNRDFAQKIDGVLKANPGSKIAVYVGSQHLGINDGNGSLNEELAKLSRDSASISLDFVNPSDFAYIEGMANYVAAKAARESGIKSYSSYQIEPAENGAKRSDYGVYIPFVELPHANIGRDVTAPRERGKSRTGAIDLPHIDPDGKLLITTDSSGKVSKARYQSHKGSGEIALPQGHESKYYKPGDFYSLGEWAHFHDISSPEKLILNRNGAFVEIIIGSDGKATQIHEISPKGESLVFPQMPRNFWEYCCNK